MKKTLFIATCLLGTTVAYAVDCTFRPQTILKVSADTVSSSEYDSSSEDYTMTTSVTAPTEGYKTVGDILEQTQQSAGTSGVGRTAIVKDGQGTLTINADLELVTPFSVREGKVVISDGVTVTNNKYSEAMLMISGTNAELVVDGGTYKQTQGNSSMSLAGYDGDGKLTIMNQGNVTIMHSLFSGTYSASTYPVSPDPMWSTAPHLGGTYTYVKTADLDEILTDVTYRDSAADTAFSDKTVGSEGERYSHGVLDISGASTMNVGQGLYLGNMTVNVDEEGSSLNSGVEGGTPHYAFDELGWGGGDHTETMVNLTNGAALNSNAVRFDMGYNDGSKVTVNVLSGSSLKHTQVTFGNTTSTYASRIGYGDNSTATLNVDGASHVSYGGGIQMGYGNDTVATVNLKGGSDMTVNATNTSQWSYLSCGDRSTSAINIEGGSSLTFNGPVLAAYCTDSTVTLNVSGTNSAFISKSTTYFTYDYNEDASGSTFSGMVSDEAYLKVIGYAYIGSSYHAANLTATRGGYLCLPRLVMQDNSTLVIDSERSSAGYNSVLYGYSTALKSGSALINRGWISNWYTDNHTMTLYGGSQLQTGYAVVSGRGAQEQASGKEMAVNYANRLDTTSLSYATDDTGTVTVGAYLVGDSVMQYLSSEDMEAVNTAVKTGLGLDSIDDGVHTIAYKHEIGEYITLELSTDHLNVTTGNEKIALNGGTMVVAKGTDDDSTGTIGSYINNSTETAATVALHAETSGSELTWKGTDLKTVTGEDTALATGNQVTVSHSSDDVENGQLTVVSKSTLLVQGGIRAATITVETDAQLTNNGTLDATVTVEGVLKGSGLVNGAVEVCSTGTLIVGNSPGYQTVDSLDLQADSTTVFCIAGTTASSKETSTGWASGTASQITIATGSLTLDANANVTIEFGGSHMVSNAQNGLTQHFEVTLVKGGCGALTDLQLTNLLEKTTFALTSEEAGLTGISSPASWKVDVSNASYSIVNDENGSNLVLKGDMVLTPEPATATLSLLALASLCARRRRK